MLSQTAAYAMRAMGYIAAHEDSSPVLARTIATEMKIPQNYLSKIVNRLVHAGLLRSIRGTGGGFFLAKDAKDIHFIDVASLFMDSSDFNTCFLGLHECDKSCKLHDRWAPIGEQALKLLKETTIDQLM